MVHIAPSILSADFGKLGEQVLETELAGAQRIHVDVMDGHFVPNLSLGPAVVKALDQVTWLPLEVHLMVTDPARFIDPFIKEGADGLIAHLEVLADPADWLRQVFAAMGMIYVLFQSDWVLALVSTSCSAGMEAETELDETRGDERVAQTKSELNSVACSVSIPHGGSLSQQTFAVTAGCPLLGPEFVRGTATASRRSARALPASPARSRARTCPTGGDRAARSPASAPARSARR